MVDDRSYEDYLQKYIEMWMPWSRAKIKNEITGKFEPVEMHFIKSSKRASVSKKMQKNSEVIWFRNSGRGISTIQEENRLREVFPELVDRLQNHFEMSKKSSDMSKNIVFYEAELNRDNDRQSPLRKQANKVLLENLVERFGYSHDRTVTLMKRSSKTAIKNAGLEKSFSRDLYLVRLLVDGEYDNARLDAFVGTHLATFSREEIKEESKTLRSLLKVEKIE